MTVSTRSETTHCGLSGIDRVPFGMHACHFYHDFTELVAALVPYTIAGLRANERCLWITAPPLPARDAIKELRAAWEGADDSIHSGALRVLDFDRWYMNASAFKGPDLVQLWLEEEEIALAEGYSGLRISGNMSFLKPCDWPMFQEYERITTARLNKRRIIALCSYSLSQWDPQQRSEVMRTHHCTFERRDADWQVVT